MRSVSFYGLVRFPTAFSLLLPSALAMYMVCYLQCDFFLSPFLSFFRSCRFVQSWRCMYSKLLYRERRMFFLALLFLLFVFFMKNKKEAIVMKWANGERSFREKDGTERANKLVSKLKTRDEQGVPYFYLSNLGRPFRLLGSLIAP